MIDHILFTSGGDRLRLAVQACLVVDVVEVDESQRRPSRSPDEVLQEAFCRKYIWWEDVCLVSGCYIHHGITSNKAMSVPLKTKRNY